MNPRLAALALLVGATTLLAACGLPQGATPQRGAASVSHQAGAPGQPAPALKPAAANAGTARAAAASAAGPAQVSQSNAGSEVPPLPPITRMVVKNGTLSIMVENPEASLSQVDQLVQSVQGTIASQTVRTQDGKVFANLTIQVPADSFEVTMGRLRDLRAAGSHVVTDTVSSQDVTDQYVDLEARYRNLQSTRDSYQALLGKATSVSDIITLTREIANIQTQMDQIKGRQNLLSHQAALSTISLTLAPVGAAVNPPQPLPRPVEAAQQAWAALLAGLQGFAVVLIWLAILLPVPAVLLGGGWLLYRRLTAA